jgi:putative transposase
MSSQPSGGEPDRKLLQIYDPISSQKNRSGKNRRFVTGGNGKKYPWRELKGQIFLGDRAFIANLKTSDSGDLKEIPRSQRYATRPALQKLFSAKRVRDRVLRNRAMYSACVDYGYGLKEVAEYLGVYYATVSGAVRAVENKNV